MFTKYPKEKIDLTLKSLLSTIYCGCKVHQDKYHYCAVIFIHGIHFTKPGHKWGIFLQKNKSGKYILTDGGSISKYILQGNNPANYIPSANKMLAKDFNLHQGFQTKENLINFRLHKTLSLASGVAAFYGLLTLLGTLATSNKAHTNFRGDQV